MGEGGTAKGEEGEYLSDAFKKGLTSATNRIMMEFMKQDVSDGGIFDVRVSIQLGTDTVDEIDERSVQVEMCKHNDVYLVEECKYWKEVM